MILLFTLLTEFSQNKPADLNARFPAANVKARRLLGRMLVLNPLDRLTVEDALKDPYLSKYHDPDDEPICVPVFDFSFEKEVGPSRLRASSFIGDLMKAS